MDRKKAPLLEGLAKTLGSVLRGRPGSPPVERRWTHLARQIDTTRWSLDVLKALEWKRFEMLCGEYFRELGFRAESTRGGPDGAIGLRLYARGERVAGILVQCRSWRTPQVGPKEVRELFASMAAEGVKEGILVACGTITPDARTFVVGRDIHLIDGEDLLAKLGVLGDETQASLLRFATRGDYVTPTCPSCGIKMVRRAPKSGGGGAHWGCPNFPRCRSTLAAGR